MSDCNYTCVANAMQTSKKKHIQAGDIFITNQGCRALVLSYKDAFNVLIEFQDAYRHRMLARAEHLRSGNIKNPFCPNVYGIGYIGVGEYLTKENGKKSFIYSIWHAMIQRCYDDKFQERNPAYKGCTVCDEWHNFQNFAEWYINQEHYGKGYHLDKDLLIDGNKVYSPKACILAPREINNLFLDSAANRGEYPLGVTYHKRVKKFIAKLNIGTGKRHLGVFDNIDDALRCYQAAKKERIKQVALKWQDCIDKKLFNALMRKAS